MPEWADQALAALERGQTVALVTVLATEGSAPREAGARMVVTDTDVSGTIGGGNLEHQVTRQALAMLERPAGDWRVQDYPLGPFLGQCCGGRVRMLVERLDPARTRWMTALGQAEGPVTLATRFEAEGLVRIIGGAGQAATARGPVPQAGDVLSETLTSRHPPVLIFGAGHVGTALARALRPLPFGLEVLDTRPQLAGSADILSIEQSEQRIGDVSAEASVLVMTHDHALDYRLTGAALQGQAGFIGLIGSATKRVRFLKRLGRDGFDESALGRLHCPIGLAGIRGKEPEVIAASVCAQLLMLRRRG